MGILSVYLKFNMGMFFMYGSMYLSSNSLTKIFTYDGTQVVHIA